MEYQLMHKRIAVPELNTDKLGKRSNAGGGLS